jgi:hypothetical protein
MANPAQLLLNQFASWQPRPQPNQPQIAEKARAHAISNNWLGQRIAVRHLDAIAELLDQIEQAGRSVRVYRQQYPTWCAMVFAYPNGWRPQGSATLDRTALDHLEGLADRLRDFVPTVNSGGLDQLRDYAASIGELLTEDDSIDDFFKLHARQVIAHLVWCLDNYDAVGDFDLQEAVERLTATIVGAAARSQRKDRWATAASTFVWPFAVNVLAAIPGNALAQLALGSGG